MSNGQYIILSGELVQEGQAFVSPANRGMMYGDGCFETIRSYKGKFLKWAAHIERMTKGFEYLEMDLPFSSDVLLKQAQTLLQKNQLMNEDAYLRIQCWRDGTRGYATSSRKASYLIESRRYTVPSQPICLKVAETRGIPNESLSRCFKLSNGLNYIKAAKEAQEAECRDALMLTVNDIISETTTANLFWIKENDVFTPSVQCDILPGITRSILLELCHQHQITIKEGQFKLANLKYAEAVFCTNSLVEILEVKRINDWKYQLGHPLFLKLKEAFKDYKIAELKS
jgi:branched-subunit amino acid aminotransferase/4-amino-4-deoxychorismate lyase